ncbi:MAG: hypothetical protein KDD70_01355 [Bdellovibrionales bacterium]|nr:hypothetical protein [Bdellovibrionales bacterium]
MNQNDFHAVWSAAERLLTGMGTDNAQIPDFSKIDPATFLIHGAQLAGREDEVEETGKKRITNAWKDCVRAVAKAEEYGMMLAALRNARELVLQRSRVIEDAEQTASQAAAAVRRLVTDLDAAKAAYVAANPQTEASTLSLGGGLMSRTVQGSIPGAPDPTPLASLFGILAAHGQGISELTIAEVARQNALANKLRADDTVTQIEFAISKVYLELKKLIRIFVMRFNEDEFDFEDPID